MSDFDRIRRFLRSKPSLEQRRFAFKVAGYSGVILIVSSLFASWLFSTWFLVFLAPALVAILMATFFRLPDE